MGRRPPPPPTPRLARIGAGAAETESAPVASAAGRPARQKGILARDQILAWQLQFRDRGGITPPLPLF